MSALSASGLLARWGVFPPWVSETFHAQFPVSITDDTEASSRTREKKNLWYPRLLLFALSTFLSPLIFVLVGYAILKDFSHLLDAKYTDRNCNGDVMTIDQ